jgi:signal peptidase I
VSSTVPVSDVIGKAVAIAWPPSRWRTLGTPKTFTALGPGGLPADPGTLALAGVLLIGGVRRRRR